jgi:predicted RecB family endonuclease
MNESIGLIREFGAPDFTRALGHNGEQLADAGFARIGFRILSENFRDVGDRKWEASRHNLDRLIERDGIQYAVEIKNQLGYIDQTEFETKLAMMKFFGARPMFIARMMPKNYINDVFKAGGFCLLLGDQHYPLLAAGLAKRVRETLGLPTHAVKALPDTALSRFENFHKKVAAKAGK